MFYNQTFKSLSDLIREFSDPGPQVLSQTFCRLFRILSVDLIAPHIPQPLRRLLGRDIALGLGHHFIPIHPTHQSISQQASG